MNDSCPYYPIISTAEADPSSSHNLQYTLFPRLPKLIFRFYKSIQPIPGDIWPERVETNRNNVSLNTIWKQNARVNTIEQSTMQATMTSSGFLFK